MSASLRERMKESKNVSAGEFLELIEKVKGILIEERKELGGYLIEISPQGKILVVVGDLHGDLESLNFILQDTR